VPCLALPRRGPPPPARHQSVFRTRQPSPSRIRLPEFPHGISLQRRFMLRRCCSESEGRVRMGSMAMCRRVGMVALLSWALLFSSVVMAADEDLPEEFDYYQIWVSQDGETHIAKCMMHGFNLTAYSSLPQYVRSNFGGEPIELVLTELAVGLTQPLHSPPQVQFVATLSGSWCVPNHSLLHFFPPQAYLSRAFESVLASFSLVCSSRNIETTDGSRHNFKKGQLLFQDNTATSPADKQPKHYSGTHGNKPCQQLVVQISRPPQVDNPCPF
jgi:hypothetical protein